MELSKEEEALLDGERGEAVALAMKAVVRVGEALGAERLIPVKWAHISGISYKNIGDAGLEFIEGLAEKGARVAVKTTLNPAGMDLDRWREMGVDPVFAEKQKRIITALARMGVEPTLTCTPYLYGTIKPGDHLAWAESNAVLYANSVLGARTNRDGGPLALFEALVGRAPLVGLHTDEGREAEAVIDLGDVKGLAAEYPQVAGYVVGSIAGPRVVVAEGLPHLDLWEVKLFLAAVGASGGTGLVYLPGVSPEEPRVRDGAERIHVDEEAFMDVINRYRGEDGVAVIGCPHLSRREVEDIIRYVGMRGGARRRLILFTARSAGLGDLAGKASRLGVEIYYDTCMVVSPLVGHLGGRVVVDSAKAAYYLASQGYMVRIASRRELLEYVVG